MDPLVYRMRAWTGPTQVESIATLLRECGLFQVMSGTEHVYWTIGAASEDDAREKSLRTMAAHTETAFGLIPQVLRIMTNIRYVPPPKVVAAVWKAWPEQAAEIENEIKPATDHCYFNRWGMYVGVEYDGYIHT